MEPAAAAAATEESVPEDEIIELSPKNKQPQKRENPTYKIRPNFQKK